MLNKGDYVVILVDKKPAATCIRIKESAGGLVELEGDGAFLWRDDGSRIDPNAICQRIRKCEGRFCLNGRHTEERARKAN